MAARREICYVALVKDVIRMRRVRTTIAVFFALVGMLAVEAPKSSAASCPLSHGFWKTHANAWNVSGVALGSRFYTNAELLTILQTPVRGDASLILAHQLIAALLNIAHGSDSTPVSTIISDANNALGGARIPQDIAPNSTLGQRMINDAAILDNYNNGKLTPICGHVAANTPPVANAGPDQTLSVAATVQLNGSSSSDADGDPLTFKWSFLSVPAGSGATLVNSTAVAPTFVADRPGNYIVQLVVNDGMANSAPDTVVISTANSRPAANAGPDQSVPVGTTVVLDGSRSSDVDGDSLTFSWSFVSVPAGSGTVLVNPSSVRPTFRIDVPGTYVVQLVVNDGHADSLPDTVAISTLNSRPVANAGPDQTTVVGQIVHLDGSGSSDVDGDELAFRWAFISTPVGSNAVLSGATSINPTFLVDAAGTYVVQLIVNDGKVDSLPDTVTITTQNSRPVANAGPDQSVRLGSLVQLDGSASSDVDGDSLTFVWSFVSRPAGSAAALSNVNAVKPTFVADVAGSYVIQLVVSDGILNSNPDTVVITTANTTPVANAGPDQTVPLSSIVLLDGTASFDADGDPLTFSWSFVSRPVSSTATLLNPNNSKSSFVADVAGTYVVQLIVNDGKINSAPDTVTISTLNSRPVANAGPDQTVPPGTTVQLDGSASSDADGDSLTFSWSFTSRPAGSTAVLSNPSAVKPTFVADLPGVYVVQLIVNDGHLDSLPDTVTISATTGNFISCGQNIGGKIDAPGERDEYKFFAEAGNVVLVAASAFPSQDGIIAEVYNPSGAILGSSSVNGTTGTVALPQTGTYTIVIRSSSPASSGQSYGLSLQFTKGQCGTDIRCGQTLQGRLNLPAAHNPYRFTGNAGDVILLAASAFPSQDGIIAEIYDPSGAILTSSSVNGTTGTVTLPQTGTFTILIKSSFPPSPGQSYGVSLQFTKGQCGTDIGCGQTLQGRLDLPAEHDPYRFTGNAGDVILLAASAFPSQDGIIAEIYNPSGAILTSSSVNGTTGTVTLPQTGTYTILIKSSFPASPGQSYGVSLQFTKGQCGTDIGCGQTLQGRLDLPAEHDPYRLTGNAGDVILLAASAFPSQDGIIAEIYNPSGVMFAKSSVNGTTGTVTLPQTGTYTILIKSSFPPSPGQSYGVSLQFTKGQCGTGIGCGQTLQGRLDLPADHDPYRFTGNAGDVILLAASAFPSQDGIIAEIYNPSGAILASTPVNGATGPITLPQTGTYTILIKSSFPPSAGQSYTVTLSCPGGI